MPGCKVLTRNCWFDVTETPSKYFGFLACLYAWQINQQVCRMVNLRLPIIIHFSNHCMLMCAMMFYCFHSCKLNFIECQSGLLSPLADCTHLSDGLVPHNILSQCAISIPALGEWQSSIMMPHLLTDDEEDEWVTEVRQSVAGNVIIHNCFLVSRNCRRGSPNYPSYSWSH